MTYGITAVVPTCQRKQSALPGKSAYQETSNSLVRCSLLASLIMDLDLLNRPLTDPPTDHHAS